MTLKTNTALPLYQQLSELLREQIRSGVYKTGCRIPSEDELRQTYSISRVTVRKAIDLLVDDGTLVRKHGLGTFVADPVFIESPNAMGSFAASCLQRGVTPSTKIIFKEIVPVSESIAKDLDVDPYTDVYEIHRLRLANNIASIYEIDYIYAKEHSYLANVDLEKVSLLEIMQKSANRIFNGVEDMIDITHASGKVAEYLECKSGTPLLSVYQKVFATDGKVIYINRQYIRSDRYKYVYRTAK